MRPTHIFLRTRIIVLKEYCFNNIWTLIKVDLHIYVGEKGSK
jgi:hypothetical protein